MPVMIILDVQTDLRQFSAEPTITMRDFRRSFSFFNENCFFETAEETVMSSFLIRH